MKNTAPKTRNRPQPPRRLLFRIGARVVSPRRRAVNPLFLLAHAAFSPEPAFVQVN